MGEICAVAQKDGKQLWSCKIKTELWGEVHIKTYMSGTHNIYNFTQNLACLQRLVQTKTTTQEIRKEDIEAACLSFQGVARRLDLLAAAKGVEVYEDFAHHPTAVGLVIEGFRKVYPDKRILVAFEPKNATSRRNTFQEQYAKALGLADLVFLGECPDDKRISDEEKMNTEQLAGAIGSKAGFFIQNSDLLEQLKQEIQPGDAVIFMSSGSFSGVQYQLAEHLEKKS
jgi:UDP-N-acetylmuramate: L-alanyl-gamma-D-glutamyl-meso-diaminopimelate ligase